MMFYTSIRLSVQGVVKDFRVGLASLYGPRHDGLWKASYETYWTSHHLHELQFIDVSCIKEVVMMAKDPTYPKVCGPADPTKGDRWYMMRKPGLGFLRFLSEQPELNIEEDL